MLMKRWARTAVALLILTVTPVIVAAQTTPPASQTQSPPTTGEQTPPAAANPGAVPQPTAPAPTEPPKASLPKAPKSAQNPNKSKFAPATEPLTAGSLDQRIILGDTRHLWHPTRSQLGITASVSGFTLDTTKTRAYLTGIAPYVHCLPVNARVLLRSKGTTNQVAIRQDNTPRPAKILPSAPGINLDIDGSIKAIQHAIAVDPSTGHVALAVKSSQPKITGAKFAGINARLAHFVTHFNPGERGRTQTVKLAISLIDGHVVTPQSVLSVNQTVGERTAQRGFGMGIVFVSGHLDKQLGGGMCQVATTLFNAVLLANLKVVERHQHVRTVPYVKPGQDATVYWGQKDFKFQNNTATPIYISYKTTATHAICDIFGKANTAVKVSIKDSYQRLGARHYTAVLKRYVTENGMTKVDYTAKSAYKWTPALDYTM